MKILSFEKSIGGVMFREDDGERQYLLLKYRNGHWSFPKGHVEKGESEEETLRREIREETGIGEIEIIPGFRILQRYWYVAKGEERKKRIKSGNGILIFKKVYHYPVRTNEQKIVICEEHCDCVWLPYETALKKITYNDSKDILKKAHNFLASPL